MKKRERGFVIVFAALFLATILIRPGTDGIDWTTSWAYNDSRPYGSSLLFERMPDLFGRVSRVEENPFVVLDTMDTSRSVYFFLTESYMPDDSEVQALLAFTEEGNHVFIAAEEIAETMLDSLGLVIDTGFKGNTNDSTFLRLANPQWAGAREAYFYDRTPIYRYFTVQAPNVRATLIGTFDDGAYNAVRIARGAGYFYVSTVPLAYTNYNLAVPGNERYVERILSYLPASSSVIWDGYHKPFRSAVTSPLRFVLSSPGLRDAYVLGMGLLLLFLVFAGKRKQRAIPLTKPLENTTVDFVETVGRLYLQRGDHSHLARTQVDQFKAYIRAHLRLRADTLAGLDVERVQARSGVELDEVVAVVDALRYVESGGNVDEEMLHELTRRLDTFYANSA